MHIEDIYEPYKKRHAVLAALIIGIFFAFFLFSFSLNWAAKPAAVQVSLIPNIPTPPPPKPEPEPEPEPDPEPEPKPEPKPDTAAEDQKRADVIRAENERKKKEEDKKRKEEEKKKKEEAEKKRKEKERLEKEKKKKEAEEKKRKEEEKKKREEEEKRKEEARLQAEAAAAEADRQAALEKRATRIADRYAGWIISRINDYLKTPASVPRDSDIVVVVQVRLNSDGSLEGIPEIIESSGYPEYDEVAVRAVLQAAPLPMPSEPFIVNNEKLMQQFLEHKLYIRPL